MEARTNKILSLLLTLLFLSCSSLRLSYQAHSHVTDLSAIRANQIQWSHGAVEETCDLHEIVVSDGPGAVNQEHQVSLGLLAHWTDRRERCIDLVSASSCLRI